MPTDEEKARAPLTAGGNRASRGKPAKTGPEYSTERRYKGRQSHVTANWEGVDADVIRHSVAAVADNGGALRLGYTKDGGAYAIGVYGDGQPYTEYVRPGDDVAQVLTDIADAFTDRNTA